MFLIMKSEIIIIIIINIAVSIKTHRLKFAILLWDALMVLCSVTEVSIFILKP